MQPKKFGKEWRSGRVKKDWLNTTCSALLIIFIYMLIKTLVV